MIISGTDERLYIHTVGHPAVTGMIRTTNTQHDEFAACEFHSVEQTRSHTTKYI